MRKKPPDPLEWHPYYRDRVDQLLAFLEDDNLWHWAVPKESSWTTSRHPGDQGGTSSVILTKRRCVGAAPYVGEPFVYTWTSALDRYGRAIAGESRITYHERLTYRERLEQMR